MTKQPKLSPEEQDLLKKDDKKTAQQNNPVTGPIVDAVDADAGLTTAPPQTLGEELDEGKVDAKKAAKEQKDVDALFQGKDKKDDQAHATEDRGDQSPAQYDDDGWGNTPVQMRGK